MFTGIEVNQNGMIKNYAERSPYAIFRNYTGIPVAELLIEGDGKGESIALNSEKKEHVHLLMSSCAVTNIIGPEYGWTIKGRQLFVNTLRWSMDATANSGCANMGCRRMNGERTDSNPFRQS